MMKILQKKLILFFVIGLIQSITQNLYSQTVQTFSVTGSQNWTCPAGVNSVTVECWGAGGGSGGVSNVLNAASGGGGGGAYAQSVISVTPGITYTIFVGAGGAGGSTSGTSGANGGASSFNTNMVFAEGGFGGGGSTSSTALGAGGNGGGAATSIGTIKFGGGAGATGILNLAGGGGGSSAGNTSTGNNAVSSTGGAAPSGGVAGASGSTLTTGAAGLNGLAGGSGSSGSRRGTNAVAYNGAFGGNGKVVLSYVCTPPTILASANPTLVCPGATSTLTATGPLTLDQYSNTGSTPSHWFAGNTGIQTFVAGLTGRMVKVRVHTATYGSSTNITLNVYSGVPGSGVLLKSVTYFKAANTNSWDDVDLNGGVNLTNGSSYFLEIPAGAQIDWISSSSNVYAAGQAYFGGSAQAYDWNFETYFDLNTYLWNPGSISVQTFTANPASTTNYTVTVTNSTGCVNTQQVVLNVNPALTTTFTQTNVLCNAGNTGAINLTATGGTPFDTTPYLDAQQTTTGCGAGGTDNSPYWQSFTTLTAGYLSALEFRFYTSAGETPTVTLRAGTGTGGAVIASGVITKAEPVTWTLSTPIAVSAGQVYTFQFSDGSGLRSACSDVYAGGVPGGGSLGTMDIYFRVFVSPYAYPYNYSWSNSATTEDISGLTAGGYTVTLSDSKGCSVSSNTTITQPTVLSASTTVTNVSCFAGSNGAINLTASGGTAPYTFDWGGGITTEDRAGIPSGVYTCTITDLNGCVTVKTTTVTQPTTALNANTTVTNVLCFGGNNGSINLTPVGGTTPYTFNWGGGITTEDRTGLIAGVYTCTVTDVNTCTVTTSATITQPASALSGATAVTNVSCFGGNNGAINLTPSGGTAAYTFNWGGGITTEDRTGIPAGVYTCTITDANGCLTTKTSTVTQPASALSGATAVTNVSCFGGTNGAINLTPSGGTAPYTFNWTGGITTEDRTALIAGVYTCTITDVNTCTVTTSATVTQPASALSASTAVTNVSCFGGTNGAINLTPSGGTTPYTFNWGGGITSEDRAGIPSGVYTCTVTDFNGCLTIVTSTITQPATALTGTTTVTNVSCFGGNNGAINLTPSGGTTPYTFNWGGGVTTEDRSGIPAGVYTCTITDINTCTISVSATVTEPTVLSANSVLSTSINCNGGSGVVTVNASGGTPTYSGTGTFTVVAGAYTYTVTDFNGCVKTTSINVTQPAPLTITVSASSSSICVGSTASLTALGASTYTWNPGLLSGSTVSVNPITTTIYSATATSSLGCTDTKTINLVVNSNPTITATASSSAICSGASATLTGSGASSYTWNPGTITSTTAVVSPSITTNYTLTGTNAAGCVSSQTINLVVNSNPTVSIVASPSVICLGQTSTLTASGATTYSWNTSATTASITVSPTVTSVYIVTGTNSAGCSSTQTLNLSVNPLPTLTISATSMSICNGSSVTLTSSGASTYTWNPGALTGSIVSVSPSSSTIYTVIGSNANGCVNTETIGITVNSNPIVTAAASSSAICVGETATLTAGGASTYSWSSGSVSATEIVTPASSSIYTVIGTDAAGCSNLATINLPVNALPVITISSSSAAICAQSSATLTASGANTYSWSSGESTSIIEVAPSVSTIYTVTGTDVLGCVNTETLNLMVNALPTLSLTTSPSSICAGATSTLSASGANTYTWSTGSSLSTIFESPVLTTIYSVTGSDAFGCVNTETISLTVNVLPSLTVSASPNVVCVGNSATLTAAGASTYSWSSGGTLASEVVSPTATTIYTVVGVDAIGCSNSDTVRVFANSLPNILTNVNTNTVCLGGVVVFSNLGANTFTLMPSALTGSLINVPMNTVGLTVYTVTGTGPLGCTNSKTVSITTFDIPSVSISPSSSTICAGQSVVLNASGASTYTWSGSGTVSNSITDAPSANISYSVIGTDINGCSNSSSATVNVSNTPTVSISSPSTSVCMGYTMTVSASGASSYNWSTGATTNTITVQPFTNTTFSVVGSNGGTCTDTAFLSLTVLPLPSVLASASNTLVCSGQTVSLSASGTAVTYVWTPGTLIGANQTVQVTAPVTYTVYGQASNGCAFLSTVFIDTKSGTTVTPITTPSVICIGDSATLSVIGGSVPSWSNNVIPTTNIVAPLVTTTYTYDATDVNGCASVIEFVVGIDPECNVVIYNGFTPNGDGINDVWIIDNIDKYTNNKVYIYNRWGNEIFSVSDYNNTTNVWDGKMNGQAITSGTYFFVIVDGSDKLIKKGWIEITN